MVQEQVTQVAVPLGSKVTLRGQPAKRGKKLATLSEGTEYKLVKPNVPAPDGWRVLQGPDGVNGWVKEKDIEEKTDKKRVVVTPAREERSTVTDSPD